MASSLLVRLFILISLPHLLPCQSISSGGSGGSLGLRIFHRFSEELGALVSSSKPWPAKGSLDYYRSLYRHDLQRHGRKLQESQVSSLVLLQGNYTEDLGPSFGGIHYAIVDIGTPNVSFIVALDTGSDLFWVPCDCKQCETEKFPELKVDLATFNSKSSSTSKSVTCGDAACESRGILCSGDSEICPYTVNYISENTSTSGKLLRDVIYLRDPVSQTVSKASIIFGCGEVQTGLFLRGGAPNGLLGLGPGAISLPSLLAKDGLISDSFSICFNVDGTGRLLLGDKGASSQQTTPLTIDGQNPAYFVGVQAIQVGNRTISSSFRTLFDTGTTLTYLPSDIYDAVTDSFNAQVQHILTRVHDQSLDPYEFCYTFNGDEMNTGPKFHFQFRGGSSFTVGDPFLYLFDRRQQQQEPKAVGICLALLKGNIPIIGQNFMEGYRLTFDRELSRLGWARANCYNLNESAVAPTPGFPRLNQSSSTDGNQDTTLNPPERAVVGSGGGSLKDHSLFVFFLLLLLPLLS